MRFNQRGLLYADSYGKDVEEKYGKLIAAQVDEDLAPLIKQLDSKLAEIRGSARLTPEGKFHETKAAATSALAEVKRMTGERRRKLDYELGQVRRADRLPTVTELAKQRGVDPSMLANDLRELREHLRRLDPVIARAELMAAANNGDVDLLLAVQAAHRLLRPVSPVTIEEAVLTWLEAQVPDEGKVIMKALRLYEANAKAATAAVAGLVTNIPGIGVEDPVAAMASKTPTAAA